MIPVIDIFAGPGGLNEGFSSVRDADGNPVFQTLASIEMESNAIETLRLRSAVRHTMKDGKLYPLYRDFLNGSASEGQLRKDETFAKALELAKNEVFQIELGEQTREDSDRIIAERVCSSQSWVLIGGPPCQAYSLAGRSRRTSDPEFANDKKHFLFREYLHIIEKFRPTMFVMENVKGLLSSKHSGFNMFERIHEDLSLGGEYRLRSLVVADENPTPSQFVIRAENYGVAQRRHRVILLGVHKSFKGRVGTLSPVLTPATVRDVLEDVPAARSTISPRSLDSAETWAAVRDMGRHHAGEKSLSQRPPKLGGRRVPYSGATGENELRKWLIDPELTHLSLHEPRAHMISDLERYEYLSLLMERDGIRPTVRDLPRHLLPAHKNVDSDKTPFLDRFKVQAFDDVSSTVTSHISKDGHYYIHPDPAQMRSFTVREAARLQSFPDNYYFCGNRTAQFHQVGNAVPPFLSRQIGAEVAKALDVL